MTRVLEISRRVKQAREYVPRFSCSDQALEYLWSHGERRDSIVEGPALDVEWTEDGSFSSREFIPHFPFMLNTFWKQVQFEAENISKFDPKLVVSDSKLSPFSLLRGSGRNLRLSQCSISLKSHSPRGLERADHYLPFTRDSQAKYWDCSGHSATRS